MKTKIKIGLVPRIIIAIIIGIVIGQLSFIPPSFIRILLTLADLFSNFLNFIIPLMIVALITKGIAELTEGAGKLLGITFLSAYSSTLIAGIIAYGISISIFPRFITPDLVETIAATDQGLAPYFSIPLEPILSVTSALVLAFLMGLGISWLKGQNSGETMYNFIDEFETIIMKTLSMIVIPLLPLYIMSNFANMSYSGSVFHIISIFWRVFLIVIILQLSYIILMFILAGLYANKNHLCLLKTKSPVI